MEWEVEFTDTFEQWWNRLSEAEQIDVGAKVRLLQRHGPALRRPHVGSIQTTSRSIMAKNFKELQARMSPKARARAQAKAERMERELALDELREAMRLTQEALADRLHVSQAAISKVERRVDMMISTLRKYIEAMGGQLEIRAIMPDGEVKITQFSDVSRPQPTASNQQPPSGIA